MLTSVSCNQKNAGNTGQFNADFSKKDSFTVKGTIENIDKGWVKLYEEAPDFSSFSIDSTQLKGGNFTLTGTLEKMLPAFLTVNDTLFVPSIFLEPGTVSIKARLKKAETFKEYYFGSEKFYLDFDIKGTTANEEFQEYRSAMEAVFSKSFQSRLDSAFNTLNGLDAVVDSISFDRYSKDSEILMNSLRYKIDSVRKSFVAAQGSASVSPYILTQQGSGFNLDVFSVVEMEELFNGLNASLSQNVFYQLCQKKLERAKKLKVGENAPDFNYQHVNGKRSSLTKMKGSYVLLEFWAHWCAPCLAKFPDLTKVYNEYATSGFEILAIHDNTDTKIWLPMHKAMGLPWPSILIDEAEGKDSSIWELYDIETLPTTYLIDKTGKIRMRNPSTEMLRAILDNEKPTKQWGLNLLN